MHAGRGDVALGASSSGLGEEQVDWEAPLSMNAPGSTFTGASATSDASSAAAGPVPSRRVATDALSLAEDAAAVRHGKCEPAALTSWAAS